MYPEVQTSIIKLDEMLTLSNRLSRSPIPPTQNQKLETTRKKKMKLVQNFHSTRRAARRSKQLARQSLTSTSKPFEPCLETRKLKLSLRWNQRGAYLAYKGVISRGIKLRNLLDLCTEITALRLHCITFSRDMDLRTLKLRRCCQGKVFQSRSSSLLT